MQSQRRNHLRIESLAAVEILKTLQIITLDRLAITITRIGKRSISNLILNRMVTARDNLLNTTKTIGSIVDQ